MKGACIAVLAGMLLCRAGFAGEQGNFYSDGPKEKKAIALTFDDGPGPYTGRVLAILKSHNIKATFFMEGDEVEFRQKIVKDVQADGHEIGSHLYSHPNFYAYEKKHADFREKMIQEADRTEKLIGKATGDRPHLLRMPNGFAKRWARDIAKEKGYVMINWTFGCDWTKGSGRQFAESYVKHIGPGAIFLMHDGGKDRSRTLEALTAVIVEAEKQGYRMVTVSELLDLKK
jgi:peptidoglycan/xylan/chitin deacetylase (PgdA/CDA1 family)